MTFFYKPLMALAATFFLLLSFNAHAASVDIYLVYAGSDKSVQKELKAALKGQAKVKSYNTDMLALADYSGKQKVKAKLGSARVIVFIGSAQDSVGDLKHGTIVAVTGSTSEDLRKIRAALGN